eukprot:912530-Pyramimonas_sp.AAC.1
MTVRFSPLTLIAETKYRTAYVQKKRGKAGLHQQGTGPHLNDSDGPLSKSHKMMPKKNLNQGYRARGL